MLGSLISRFQARRIVGAAIELNEVYIALPIRQLHKTKPVAHEGKAERFRIDRDDRPNGKISRQVAVVQVNR